MSSVVPDQDARQLGRERRSQEIAEARAWLTAAGVRLSELEENALWHCLLATGLLWVVIGVAVLMAARCGIVAFLAAIPAIGVAQRGLGNLFHDLAHAGSRHNRLVERILEVFLGLPMFTSIGEYRRNHFAHHANLGDPSLDPDFIHDFRILQKGPLRSYLEYVRRKTIWLSSTFGQLAGGPTSARMAITIWWSIILFAVGRLLGLRVAIILIALWFLSRATFFHFVTTFREMADHVGLEPGGIKSFTRNSPSHGFWRRIIHPLNNGLHIAHHLLPRVPYYRLRAAHEQLLAWTEYAKLEHCPTYLLDRSGQEGPPSVAVSFSRLALTEGKSFDVASTRTASDRRRRRA